MRKVVMPFLFLLSGLVMGEEWIWTPVDKVISNSVWTLNAYESNGSLWVGTEGATTRGNAFTGRGAGELDLSGAVVSIGENGVRTSWSIVGFTKAAFGFTKTQEQVIKRFVFPTTTTSISVDLFRGYDDSPKSKVLTNVVCVVPSCTKIGDYAFLRNEGLANFTLIAPNMTELSSQSLNCGALGKVDYTQWELPAVKALGSAAIAWTGGSGCLKLPKVKDLYSSALYSMKKLQEVELGTGYTLADKTVLRVEKTSLGICEKLGKITIGPYASFNFIDDASETAFAGDTALTNIVFTGRILSNAQMALDALLVSKTTITETTKAKQVVVYASTNLGWSAVAKACTDAERALCPDYVTDENCMGIYETSGGARKAWLVQRTSDNDYAAIDVTTQDARFNDTFTIQGTEERDGRYLLNSTVTIRAVCDETTFQGWEGLPEGAVTKGLEATFIVNDSPMSLTLKTAPKWTYLPEEGVISNRAWKLRVNTDQLSGNRLRVGNRSAGASTAGNAFTELGEGILDLSGEVFSNNGSEKWTITHLGTYALAIAGDSSVKTNEITKFVFPRETESIASCFIRSHDTTNDGKQNTNLLARVEEIIMDIPNYRGTLGSHVFLRLFNLKRLYINAPKMVGIGTQSINTGAKLDQTDYTEWDISAVRQIDSAGMAWTSSATGYLKLSSVTNLANGAIRQNNFHALDLGSFLQPRDRQSLTLDNNACFGCSSVTSVVFGAYTKLVLPANPVANLNFTGLKTVHFLGAVPENVKIFVDTALSGRGVPSDATKYAVIRASANLGWGKVAAPVDTSNETEVSAAAALTATLAKGEELMGVYTSAAGDRLAWLVHSASPYDPKGTFLILR